MRWALLLQEYGYTVEHVPGKLNELPDLLSRQPGTEQLDPCVVDEERLQSYKYQIRTEPAKDQLFVMEEDDGEPLVDEVQNAQQEDPEIAELGRQLAEAAPEDALREEYTNLDGYLRRRVDDRHLLVVPQAVRERVLFRYHDHHIAGHPGAEETIQRDKQIQIKFCF